MKKIETGLLLVCLSLFVSFSILISANDANCQPQRVLKFAHGMPNEHATGIAALKFAELVGQRTNNRVKVQVFPSSQLGNERDQLEGEQMGSIDIGYNSGALLGGFVEQVKICDLPFIFRDYDHLDHVITGRAGKLLLGEIDEGGQLKGLAIGTTGWRHVMNNKRPVNTPADMKGLKIRVFENPIYVDTYKALGAVPTPVPWGEVPMALRTGLVDGSDLPTGIITQQNMFDLVKYVSLTGIQSVAFFCTMNRKTFQSFSPTDQKILVDAAMEATALNRKLTKEQDDDALKQLPKHGIKINEVDRSLFRKITDSVYKKYEGILKKELVNAIVETR